MNLIKKLILFALASSIAMQTTNAMQLPLKGDAQKHEIKIKLHYCHQAQNLIDALKTKVNPKAAHESKIRKFLNLEPLDQDLDKANASLDKMVNYYNAVLSAFLKLFIIDTPLTEHIKVGWFKKSIRNDFLAKLVNETRFQSPHIKSTIMSNLEKSIYSDFFEERGRIFSSLKNSLSEPEIFDLLKRDENFKSFWKEATDKTSNGKICANWWQEVLTYPCDKMVVFKALEVISLKSQASNKDEYENKKKRLTFYLDQLPEFKKDEHSKALKGLINSAL